MNTEEDIIAPTVPPFVHILENEVVNKRNSSSSDSSDSGSDSDDYYDQLEETFPCDCNSLTACDEDTGCINRTLFIECNPRECPAGNRCQNQRFQKRKYVPLEVFETPGQGHGLRPLRDVKEYGDWF